MEISKTISLVNANNTVKYVEYLDGFQYTGGELNFFPHAEGYVNVTLGTTGNRIFNYVYNYTDHLGNIRLSYTKDMVNNQLKILEENHYYPFGLKHQKYTSAGAIGLQAIDETKARPANMTSTPYAYKYNGQEWQDELGLNMYDMDMRQYDPAIARWVVLDPVIHHSMSPYNAFDNNPVFWADPSGADAVGLDSNGGGEVGSVFDQEGVSASSVTVMGSGMEISAGGAGDNGGGDNDMTSRALGKGGKSSKGVKKVSGKMVNQGITSSTEDGQLVLDTQSVSMGELRYEGPIGGHVFAGLETVMGAATNYIVGKAFDAFGWNKDYQDEASMALGLVVSKGKPNTVSTKTGIEFTKHATQRMAERGITETMVEATISKGTKYLDPKNGTYNYILKGGFASGKDLLIGVSPQTNKVTNVIRGNNLVKSRFISQ